MQGGGGTLNYFSKRWEYNFFLNTGEGNMKFKYKKHDWVMHFFLFLFLLDMQGNKEVSRENI